MKIKANDVTAIEAAIAQAMASAFPGKDFQDFKLVNVLEDAEGELLVTPNPDGIMIGTTTVAGKWMGDCQVKKITMEEDKATKRMDAHEAVNAMYVTCGWQHSDIERSGNDVGMNAEEKAAYTSMAQVLMSDFATARILQSRPFTIIKIDTNEMEHVIEMGFSTNMLWTKMPKIEEKLGEGNSLRIIYRLPRVVSVTMH